jgi:hypothetical protein
MVHARHSTGVCGEIAIFISFQIMPDLHTLSTRWDLVVSDSIVMELWADGFPESPERYCQTDVHKS